MDYDTFIENLAVAFDLVENEKHLLRDFDNRISFIYDHSILISNISSALLAGDREKIDTAIAEAKKKLAGVYQYVLSTCKQEEKLSSTMNEDSVMKAAQIKAFDRAMDELNTSLGRDSARLALDLRKYMDVVETELNLYQEFHDRLTVFKKTINDMALELHKEFSLMEEIGRGSAQGRITREEASEKIACLAGYESSIKEMLHQEKIAMHKFLSVIFNQERSVRLALKALSCKEPGALLKEIKRHIASFKSPDEYGPYFAFLLSERSVELPPRVEEYLRSMKEKYSNPAIAALSQTSISDSDKDELSGIYNRKFCLREAPAYFQPEGSASLILIDVDSFRRFRTAYGKSASEDLLKAVSLIFQSSIKNIGIKDVIIRIGTEMFLVLLAGIDKKQASVVAERIRSSVQRGSRSILADLNRRTIVLHPMKEITVSIGVSSYPSDGNKGQLSHILQADSEILPHGTHESIAQFEHCLEIADRRLYIAKASGKNSVVSEDNLTLGIMDHAKRALVHRLHA